jgi:hypothetical protein
MLSAMAGCTDRVWEMPQLREKTSASPMRWRK